MAPASVPAWGRAWAWAWALAPASVLVPVPVPVLKRLRPVVLA